MYLDIAWVIYAWVKPWAAPLNAHAKVIHCVIRVTTIFMLILNDARIYFAVKVIGKMVGNNNCSQGY